MHDEVAEQAHFVVRHATHDVVRAQLAQVLQAGYLYQFLQRMQRTAMEIAHPLDFVRRHQRHQMHQVKRAENFSRCTNRNTTVQVNADQRIVNQLQALLHQRTDMVAELDRRGAGTAFSAIDDDKVRRDVGGQHGFDNRKPVPRVANAKLETDRFTA